MRLVVSDSGVLHALQRASLLRAALSSQDEIVVSDVLFQRELAPEGFANLPAEGLQVEELDASALARALCLRREQPGISVTDALAIALAFPLGGRILSECAHLCRICKGNSWPCHNAAWMISRTTNVVRDTTEFLRRQRAS